MAKEGAIIVKNNSSTFCIIRNGRNWTVITTSGSECGQVRHGEALRLSLRESFLIKDNQTDLVMSSSSNVLNNVNYFIIETENSSYLTVFNPSNGLFTFTKRSGSNQGLAIGGSLNPSYLVFLTDGTLALFNAQGQRIYKTSHIKNITL